MRFFVSSWQRWLILIIALLPIFGPVAAMTTVILCGLRYTTTTPHMSKTAIFNNYNFCGFTLIVVGTGIIGNVAWCIMTNAPFGLAAQIALIVWIIVFMVSIYHAVYWHERAIRAATQ